MTCLNILSCALICYHEKTCLQRLCFNWIDDKSTLTLFFPATADATTSNEASLERTKDTL